MKYIVKVKLPIGWWPTFETPSFKAALDKYCRLAKQKHSVRLVSYDWFCTIYINSVYGFVFIYIGFIFIRQKKMSRKRRLLHEHSANNREAVILMASEGLEVDLYEDEYLIETRKIYGYSEHYAESLAENWVLGNIKWEIY